MKIVSTLPVFLLIFGCSQSTEIATDENKEIDYVSELAAIEALRTNFELAIKEGRYDDLRKWASSDIKTVGAGGAGWDEMRRLGQERGMFPYDSIKMRPTETKIMNDSMAYDWGTSLVYYTDEEGTQMELQDSFLVLLKKENGEWKLHREVASSVVK